MLWGLGAANNPPTQVTASRTAKGAPVRGGATFPCPDSRVSAPAAPGSAGIEADIFDSCAVCGKLSARRVVGGALSPSKGKISPTG